MSGALALLAGGCGADHSSEATATAAEALPRKYPPEIKPHTGLPPKKLVVRDIVKGTGKKLVKGDRVKLQYYGVDWGHGIEHASSWNYEHIPIFTVGEHRLQRGLNIAVHGMREGGSREVVIPYNLVYYPGGHHRPLGPLDALIYKVYLVRVLKR